MTDTLQILIILIDKSSYPCDLLESNDFITNNISFLVPWKVFILVFVLYEKDGNILVFIGDYTDAKGLLK